MSVAISCVYVAVAWFVFCAGVRVVAAGLDEEDARADAADHRARDRLQRLAEAVVRIGRRAGRYVADRRDAIERGERLPARSR